jgi:hypothetical protein
MKSAAYRLPQNGRQNPYGKVNSLASDVALCRVRKKEGWGKLLGIMRLFLALFTLTLVSGPCANAQSAAAAPQQLQVCCRPLPKWSSSRNWLLRALNVAIVDHIRHCYVDFPAGVVVPGLGAPVRTAGIHPWEPGNNNKQPVLDQVTDSFDRKGTCKQVKDATPEKIQLLAEEIAAGTCYSCGKNYHNRVLTCCFNNSNTYVYELIRGAGMTPPPMRAAPGYRRHHECGGGAGNGGSKP